jgi:hypothetical protein
MATCLLCGDDFGEKIITDSKDGICSPCEKKLDEECERVEFALMTHSICAGCHGKLDTTFSDTYCRKCYDDVCNELVGKED